MNPLIVAFFIALAPLCVWADTKQEENRAVYHTVNRPYNYRPYGVDTYKTYDAYDAADAETFGAYPWTADFGAQRLHLSGGIYRPYGYDDYDDSATYAHYGNARYASRYRPSYSRRY